MIRFTFLGFALMLLSACAPAPTDALSIARDYRVMGRHQIESDGALTFAWPASGVEGRFVGRRLVARIRDGGDSIMDLAIDGEVTQLPLDPGEKNYVLFSSNTREEHVIRLTRRSEGQSSGLTTILSLSSDGSLTATPTPERRILFIGDSITVGYGASGADQHCPYSAETSPPFYAYAALTSKAFDADFQLVAISGRGITRNYDGAVAMTMPSLIDSALPDLPMSRWDHARFMPHVVVISLATNDYSTSGPNRADFTRDYVGLLRAVAQRFPEARVIAAYGPEEKPEAVADINAAVQTFNQGAARPVTYFHLPPATSGHIFGCDWHPGRDTHRVMARALSAEITREIGWTAHPIE